jgi:ATP-dependent RNA helicase RhlE
MELPVQVMEGLSMSPQFLAKNSNAVSTKKGKGKKEEPKTGKPDFRHKKQIDKNRAKKSGSRGGDGRYNSSGSSSRSGSSKGASGTNRSSRG